MRLFPLIIIVAFLCLWCAPAGAQSASELVAVRAQAEHAMQLGDVTGGEVDGQLIALLRDPQMLIRAQAAASLARRGETAVAAMIAALDRSQLPVASTRGYGNNGRAAVIADYLAYALVYSRADPGEALLAWARRPEADAKVRGGRLRVLGVILGLRGIASLGVASRLIDDDDPALQIEGYSVLARLGPQAADMVPAIVQRLGRLDGASASRAIAALGDMGPKGQAALRSILRTDGDTDLRLAAANALKPGPESTDTVLAVFGASTGQLRDTLRMQLARAPQLPVRAAPLFARDLDDADGRFWAALALIHTDAGTPSAPALADQLAGYLVRRPNPNDIRDMDENRSVLALALAALGEPGTARLEVVLRDPSQRALACPHLEDLDDYKDIERIPTQPDILAALRRLARAYCPAPTPAPMPRANGSSDGLGWTIATVNMDSALAAATFLASDDPEPDEYAKGCTRTAEAIDRIPDVADKFATAPLATLGLVAQKCPAAFSAALARALFPRLAKKESGYDKAGRNPDFTAYSLLKGMSALESDTTWLGANLDALRLLARSDDPNLRALATRLLQAGGSADTATLQVLANGLDDPEIGVEMASAEAIATGTPGDAIWAKAQDRILVFEVASDVDGFLEAQIDRLRPPDFWLTAAHFTTLPPFPWPPPRYTSIVTFGREIEREILGKPSDTLGQIEEHIVHATEAIDPGFESRLFSIPGGYVLLTRLEQTNSDGSPLQGGDRWRDVRPPPASIRDFLLRLFFAPPGFYRTVAFAFTDQSNFGYGSGQLPRFEQGGTELPSDLAQLPFTERKAYALVYAFEKRDSDRGQPYPLISAMQHLQRSGLVAALQRVR